jgi:hypothetical protein
MEDSYWLKGGVVIVADGNSARFLMDYIVVREEFGSD